MAWKVLHEGMDCWTELVDGEEKPLRFPSHAAAEMELNEYLEEIRDAVAAGDMLDNYDDDDFQIVFEEESE